MISSDSRAAVYVGTPNAPYQEGTDPGLCRVQVDRSQAGQDDVYAGANDGMLHVFDDATGNENVGVRAERSVSGRHAGGDPKTGLGALSYQDGALPPFKHHFLRRSDTEDRGRRLRRRDERAGWRTVLVGGLGKGGAAYYALDVTDPAGIINETKAVSNVLWEFKRQTSATRYGKPMIVKTHAFRRAPWVVIVPSGYNNPTASASSTSSTRAPANC